MAIVQFKKPKRSRKGTLCIDFDNTIVQSKFPFLGPLKKNAKERINQLYQKYFIIISSCRTNSAYNRHAGYREIKNYLDEQGILYDYIDDGTQGKIIADVYIDDKAIRFKDNWNEITETLLKK